MSYESPNNGAKLLDLDRGPSIAGTRITVYTVLEYLIRGRSRETIAEWLRVTPEQVQAAIDYIADNDLEVLRQYAKIMERIRRGNSPEVEAKLAANRPRFEELVRKAREAGSQSGGEETVRALIADYRRQGTREDSNAGNHGGQRYPGAVREDTDYPAIE